MSFMLEIVLHTGMYVPAFIAAAYLLWRAGVRDPLALTVLALLLGAIGGYALNIALEKLFEKRSVK